ncbi:MAG: hypothetical protein HZB91_05285 [Elusimicrobia bacterium]|nr:hypothetical protein [Elusimicrobiota bacterium]
MSLDPFRKVWHEEYRREVEEVLSNLHRETGKPSADSAGVTDQVIPPARVFQDLKTAREKLAELLPHVEDLRHRLETADKRLDEELRRREKLKDVIVKLNFEVRRLETEARDGKDRSEAGIRRLDEAHRKLREAEAGRHELSETLERSRDHETQLKGTIQSLKIRAEELQVLIDSRDIEIQSLKKRYDAACVQHGQQLAERENELDAAMRRNADKQAQLERALSEREGHASMSLSARTELGQRLAEASRLTVELQSLKETLRTEREAHLQAKASWDDEIERRRSAEVQIREAAHQLEMERQAAGSRLESMRVEHEKSLAEARQALQRVETESLRAHVTLEEARKFEADCAALFRKQMEELQDERQRLLQAHHKELADAQTIREGGLSALASARKLEEECRRREESLAQASEEERAKARAMQERALEIEQHALSTLEAERAKLQAEHDAAMERSRKDSEAARASTSEDKNRLYEDVRDQLEKARKAELQAETRVSEMESLLQAEKARMKEGVKDALDEVGRSRAESAEAAGKAARALAGERAKLDAEKIKFLDDLDAERRKLYADVEAESRAAALETDARLKAERAALRREFEEEARVKVEAALLRQKSDAERAAIALQAKSELDHALEPTPRVGQAGPAAAPVLPAGAPIETSHILDTMAGMIGAGGPASHATSEQPAPAPVPAVPVPAQMPPPPASTAPPPASTAPPAAETPRKPVPTDLASEDLAPLRQAPKASRRLPLPAKLAFAVLLTAGAVAGGLLHLQGLFAVRTHPVPFKHPTALVWVGSELWVSDWFDQAVYRMALEKGKLSVLRRYALPGSHVTGLAVDGSTLYLADSWKKAISKYRVGPELELEASWPSPGPNPSALSLEGKYLWSGDAGTNSIYRHAIDESLTVLNAYPVSFSPVCLEKDGGRFWSAGSDGRMVLRLNERMGLSEAFVHPRLEDGWQSLSCMAIKGGRFWVGRDGLGLLVELPRSSLRSVPPPVPAPIKGR